MKHIITTQAILLRNSKRRYDIGPGNYFLEEKIFGDKSWLMLFGMPFGLPTEEWLEMEGKIVFFLNEDKARFV